MESTKQWYVVYTKAGQERKTCDMFRRRKLDSFYPANKLTKNFYGKERISYKPVLERYVFVCLAKEELSKIKSVNGVINFVHWLAQPVTVSNDDVYLLRRFFDMHDGIQVQKMKINPAEPASMSNQFSDDNHDRVNFTLPVLGFVMTAQINKTTVKVITVPGYKTKPKLFTRYAEAR